MMQNVELLRLALFMRLEYLRLENLVNNQEYQTLFELLESCNDIHTLIVEAQTRKLAESIKVDIELTCDYSGSGDSGGVESVDINISNKHVYYEQLTLFYYDHVSKLLLEVFDDTVGREYSDYGDNDGGQGTAKINVFNLLIDFDHSWNVYTTEDDGKVVDLAQEILESQTELKSE